MPLYVITPSNKKLAVPFKPTLTVKAFISDVVKRGQLSPTVDYRLELNASELYQEDTLEDLGISDGAELVLIDESQQTSNPPPTVTTPAPVADATPQVTSTDPNNNIGNFGNLSISPPTTTTTSTSSTSTSITSPTTSIFEEEIRQIDVIVLDLSGSMKSPAYHGSSKPGELEMTRIEAAQALFQTFIDKFVSHEYPVVVGLVSFGERIEATFPITRNFDSFSTELGAVDANQAKTRLFEAIKMAADVIIHYRDNKPHNIRLAPADKLISRIFCLTDGEDNSGVDPFPIYQHLKQHNIILDSIPIGDQGRVKLSAFTKATGGTCFIADSSAEGVALFEREALLMLEHRQDFKPFSINVPNRQALDGLGGTYTKVVERKVEASLTTKCSGKVSDAAQTRVKTGGGHLKRILNEYSAFKQEIAAQANPQFHIFVNDNDLQVWKVVMAGPPGTEYGGGLWVLSVQFPDDYPFKPPKVRFQTQIYHCNVSSDGNLCLDILKDNWSPALTIHRVFLSIASLLTNPNPDDPLDVVKAGVYRDNRPKYIENVKAYVTAYASLTLSQIKQLNSLE